MSMTTGREPVRIERASTPAGERVLSPLARASLRFLLVAAAAVVVAIALVKLRLLVVPFVVAVLASTLLVPPARRLRAAGVPAAPATMLVVVTALGLVAALVALIAPPLVAEADEVGEAVDRGVDEVARWVAAGPFGMSADDVDRLVDRAGRQLQSGAGTLAAGVVSVSLVALEILAGALLALVMTFFLVHDGERVWRFWIRMTPPDERERMAWFGAAAWRVLSAYVRGVVLVAFVDAVFIALALALIGVPLVLPLAVLTFLAAFVPLVGAVVAGAVAALVALVFEGWVAALLVLAAITLVQQLEGNLLYPVVVGRALELHPVAILASVTAGGVLLGVVGAALAVPIAAVMWAAAATWREEAPT
jgi:putative heme transporter